MKYVNPYKVLITLDTEENANLLCVNKTFIDKGWKCQKTLEVGLSYGVLRDCEAELDDKEILESLSTPIADIISLKRLNYRNAEGKWIPSESVRICFKGSTLPAYVYIHGIKTKIDQFKFPVTQCSKCWRFGHSGKLCPSRKITCPKCSDNHANCETQIYKCANCGGNHMALSKRCPVYLKEKKVRDIMAEFNCTYRMALSMYVPSSPRTSPIPDIPNIPNTSQRPSTAVPLVNTPTAEPELSDSYASRLSQNIEKTPYKPKASKKSKVYAEPDWENPSSLHGDSINTNVPQNDCESNKQTNRSNLLQRLKEVILMKECDLMTKIKKIAQIIGEWLVSYLMKNIPELNIFRNLFDGVFNQ